jgi:hypothetical protein
MPRAADLRGLLQANSRHDRTGADHREVDQKNPEQTRLFGN